MKLKIRYENEFQTVELDAEATEKMWLSLSLECDDDMTQEKREERIQEEWDEQFNKPEYNIYHREIRHLGDAVFRNKEGVVEVNTGEALIRKAADDSIFTKDMVELEHQMECEYQDKRCRDFIRSHLSLAQADMVSFSLQLGNFAFIPRTNGNLSFKKLDTDNESVAGLAIAGESAIE